MTINYMVNLRRDRLLTPRLTTSARLAVHALIVVARSNEARVTAAHIEARTAAPRRFLDQLLGRLQHQHLLNSVRGPHGGYALNRPASEITLADILLAVDGAKLTLASEPVAASESTLHCESCQLQLVWQQIATWMSATLAAVTLADLASQHGARPEPAPPSSDGQVDPVESAA
jgi:Rrf2 family iron-sulfur cluster assembly transcriptional regulator